MSASVAVISLLAAVGATSSGAVPTTTAAVHAVLEASVPADGEMLAVAPREITLAFSGLVEETGAVVRLLGPAGQSWALEAVRPSTDPRVLAASLPELSPGGFRVEWRVISADGHPVSGDWVFFVGVVGQVGSGLEPPPPSGSDGPLGPMVMGSSTEAHTSSSLTVSTRVVADWGLLGLAGLLLFLSLGGTPSSTSSLTVAKLLAIIAALSATTYGWFWTGEVLGVGSTGGDRFNALTSLVSGRPLGIEIVVSWLALWALVLAQRPALAAVLAFGAVAAGGWGGHPASYTPIVSSPANAVHLVAAAAWTGGLLYLVIERGLPSFETSARRVSGVALVAGAAVAVTGLLQTWLILESPSQLLASPYGRIVLVKVLGLVALIVFGAYHRFRLLPDLSERAGGDRLSRSVRRELFVAAGVVAVAAVLAHIPPTS